MEYIELKYNGHNHMSIVEHLFEINDDLKHFSEEVNKILIQEMALWIIPKNLKTAANLKYYNKGDDKLLDKDDISNLCCRFMTMLQENMTQASTTIMRAEMIAEIGITEWLQAPTETTEM